MSGQLRPPHNLPASVVAAQHLTEDGEVQFSPESGIVIRDLRTNERWWVHDSLVDDYGPLLGADAFTIYASLSCMANKNQYCWPSLTRLAHHWSKGKATVVRATRLLEDLRLIAVQRSIREDGGDGNNVYYLLEPLPFKEGIAHLLASLCARGHSPVAAVTHVIDLLPKGWEPLRTKKATIKSRAAWVEFVTALTPRATEEPGGPTQNPGGSPLDPAGPGENMGGSPLDSPVSCENTGGPQQNVEGSTMNQDGSRPDRDSSISDLGRVLAGTVPVSGQNSKESQNQGNPINQTQEGNQQQGHAGGGVLMTDEEIINYPLAADEVFIIATPASGFVGSEADAAIPASLHALVRSDIVTTYENWGIMAWTECYYSASQFLGVSGDLESPAEQQKRELHMRLRRELDALYKELGAFSIREALAAYFSADVIAILWRDDPTEEQRVRGWLRYIRSDSGKGLDNPAGFLRSRIESGQWPPRVAARRREAGTP